MREGEQRVPGCGMGRVTGWRSRKAVINYTRCRMGKGNLLRWQMILDPDLEDDRCRECGLAEETGAQFALVCRELENVGLVKRFGSWKQVDDPDRVIRRRKELNEFGREGVITVDMTEFFFAELGDI